MQKKQIFFSLILITVTIIFCQCSRSRYVLSVGGGPLPAGAMEEIAEVEEIPPPTRAEVVTRALMQAYPDIIKDVGFRNDDWAVLMRNKWYHYAGGRLLPENELENTSNYRSMSFYGYPEELPEWVERTPEESRRFSSWTGSSGGNRTQTTPVRRSHFFLDSLWQAGTQIETESRMVRINFLGKQARVHELILERLLIVEAEIRAAAAVEPEIQTFINTIGSIESYGWRNIAISDSRSYHSYGLALDILPRSLGGKQTYWLWTSQSGRDWWNVPYSQRYHPPAAVTRIFESYGFIWGGKWQQYDTMHYEYRPEILILAGLTVIGLND